MNNSTSYDFTQLNPDNIYGENCSNVMQVWSYLQYNATQDVKFWADVDSNASIYEYIVQDLKEYASLYELPFEPPPMNQDFWNWTVKDKLLLDSFQSLAWVHCPEQLCKTVGWEGSPDIAGVGMLATYIIQAVLALSTWAPFIIEFGYNIWEGPKKANEARANYPSKSALQGPSAIESSEEDEERGNFEMLK
ncbi:unnamed protein product [Alternaria alternata]